MTGTVEATAAASGDDVDAAFAHVLTVEDGVVTRFVEYADSHRMRRAL